MSNGRENPLMRAFQTAPEGSSEATEEKLRLLAKTNPLMRAFVDEAGLIPPTATFVRAEPVDDVGPGESFLRGIRRGTEFPFQLLGVEQAESIAETGGEKVAEIAGEFVGFGLSYIPFTLGAGVLLRGIGLTAKLSPAVTRFAKGTLALAGFEAGGSPSLEEAPEHFARGLAFGAAFEGILLARALKHRARLPAGPGRVAHEDLLAIERQLALEGKTSDEIEAILAALPNEEAQYDFVLGNLARVYQPNGFAIIPGIRDPERLASHMKRIDPDMRVVSRVTDPDVGIHEVLLFDQKAGSRLVGAKDVQHQADIANVFMGEGPRSFSFKEMIDLIRTDVPGERIRPPTVIVADAKTLGIGTSRGNAHAASMTMKVRSPDAQEFSTMLHEYTHLFNTVLDSTGATRRWGSIPEIFGLDLSKELPGLSVQQLEALDKGLAVHLLDPKNLPPLLEEFRQATIEVVWRSWGSVNTREQAAKRVDKIWKSGYAPGLGIGDDSELMSRLAELMLMDPKRARELAPKATALMAQLIKAHSPKLEAMLSRRDLKKLHEVMKTLWIQDTPDSAIQFLRRATISFGKKQEQQFIREGAVSGMGVFHNGKMYEHAGISRKDPATGALRTFDPQGTWRLRDPKSGRSFEVPASEVERPLLPRMARYSDEIKGKLRQTLEQDPKWVGFVIPHPKQGVQRGIVTLENFEKVNLGRSVMGKITRGISSVKTRNPFVAYARNYRDRFQNLFDDVTGTVETAGQPFDVVGERFGLRQAVLDDLVLQGKEGMAVFENGLLKELYVADQKAVALGERLSEAFGLAVDDAQTVFTEAGGLEVFNITPSFRNGVTSLLREAGVAEREISFFIDEAERMYADALLDLAEDEVKTAVKKASVLAGPMTEEVSGQAARNNLRARETASGSWRVSSTDHVPLGEFETAAEARTFMSRLGHDLTMEEPLRSSTVPTKMGNELSGGGKPPKPQEQLTRKLMSPDELPRWRRLIHSFNFLGGKWWTGSEQLAVALEELGFGPAASVIHSKSQLAMRAMDNELVTQAKELLGGRTYAEVFKTLHKIAAPISTERQELISRAVEFLTKSEIARPGGLLQRGMTAMELDMSSQLVKAGLAHEVPRLQQTNRMMGLYLQNRRVFLEQHLPEIQAMIERGTLNENLQAYVEKFSALAESVSTKKELMQELGLSVDERWLIDLLDNPPSTKLDEFSWMAVSRHAAAPELKSGYKSGREMFMTEKGFNAAERRVVDELDNLFATAFQGSGLDPKRMIGGYFPHLRQYGEWMGVEEAEKFFKDIIPDAVDWVSARVRTGEVDLYNLDPLVVAAKHIRNMLMRKHLDPVLPEISQAIRSMKRRNIRAGELMEEYMNELLGRPHKTFKVMNQVIDSLGKIWGFNVDERVAERFIGTMVKLAHEATIPFRPALVLRNSWQSPQMTIPIIGGEAWWHGVKKAMSGEGFKEAVNKNAIDLNIAPLFAGELFGFRPDQLRRINTKVARMGIAWEDFFNRGFNWYRKPDDVGRAIAFHGAKFRQAKHLPDFMNNKITLEEFKQRAKVMIYDEPVVQEWEQLVRAGDFDGAGDLIGRKLADMTHFRYGHANHPIGWAAAPMRLFGQFGTFPVQYKDLMLQMSSRGTMKDRIEFFGGQIALNGSLVLAGAAVGVNLFDWTAWPSLNYSGGPYADMALNLYQSVLGGEQERRLARNSLGYALPSFENPQSIFLPGSYLIGDLADMLQEDSPGRAFGEGLGFRFLEPGDRTSTFLDRAFNF